MPYIAKVEANPNGAMLEYRLNMLDQTAALYKQTIPCEDGYLQVPQGSGFGLEPDEEILRECQI